MARELPEWVKEKDNKKKKEGIVKKLVVALTTLVVIGLIGGVGVLIHNGNNKKNNQDMTVGKMTPKNITSDGSLHIIGDGESNANSKENSNGVRTVMYFDPMCPACGTTERALGDTYSKYVKDKTIDFYMNPVAFLNNSSSDMYSSRAVNAIITVSENDPKHTYNFIKELYKETVQPKEAAGYVPVSDNDLAKTAKKVGVSSSAADKFKDHSYMKWIEDHTLKLNSEAKEIFPEGISTPTILMGGETRDSSGNPTEFTRVVLSGQSPIVDTFNNTLAQVKAKEGK